MNLKLTQLGIVALLAMLLLSGLPRAARAASDAENSTVTVTMPLVVGLFYTAYAGGGGNPYELTFVWPDAHDEEMELLNHGYVTWVTTSKPWKIKLSRSHWRKDGDPSWPPTDKADKDFKLQVRQDTSGKGFKKGYFDVRRDGEHLEDWIKGEIIGTGHLEGVDWKAHTGGETRKYFTAGTYRTTITFTLEQD